MTQQYIAVGPAPNDGLGDPIRTAFIKTNDNFSQLYSRAQTSPPPTLIGSIGDQAGMYAYDSTYFYYCFADYTGNSTIWAELEQAGNISATQILNGTSSIAIASTNANATVSINGTPNVVVFHSTGANITGYLTASGNVQGGNIVTVGKVSAGGNITGSYFLGNGSQLTGLPELYGNANVANFLPTYSGAITSTSISASGNITGANVLTNGLISAQGNIITQGVVSATGDIITDGLFIGNFAGNIVANIVVPGANTQVLFNLNGNADAVGGMTYNKDSNTFIVLGTISSQGNTIGGNINTGGLISAAGNITAQTGSFFIGNGSLLTGTYSNSNVSSLLSVFGSNTVSTTGNITGGNILTSGLMSSTGNATHGNILTGGLVSASGNVSGNYLKSTNDVIVGGNISTTNLTGTGISITGNITGGNILTSGIVSTNANITGGYFFGNGVSLTGVISSYGNSNVTTLLSGLGSNTISTTGNITSGNFLTGGLLSATSTITGGNLNTGGNISASGNISGGNLIMPSGTGNVTSHDVNSGGNVSVTGFVSAAGNVTGANIVTGGNLSVSGVTTINSGGAVTAIVNGASNGVGNIGASGAEFNTVFAKATTAQYADLAEIYTVDADYESGTVVVFGGEAEVTTTTQFADVSVAGAISTDPAYLMNSSESGLPVALRGRVPVKVVGPVYKGDLLVTAGANPGYAVSVGKNTEYPLAVFAKAIETNTDEGAKVITAVIL